MDRRTFMQYSSGIGVFGVFAHPVFGKREFTLKEGITQQMDSLIEQGYFSDDLSDPKDEAAWEKIQKLFPRVEAFTQLENGYFSHASLPVFKFYQERESYIQSRTSWFMRKEQHERIEWAREQLADFFGWNKENLAFTRNTTESLNILISGFPWKKGDEVIIGNQDYGSMNEAFEQAAQRYGIVLKVAEVPVHPNNAQEVEEAYLKLIGPQTRMLHLTHLINLSGQVIPLDSIVAKTRSLKKDLCTAVDAAHSVAHVDYIWQSCDADVIAGSLHKWMCTPLGLGFLYMKKQWIPQVWPLMGDRGVPQTDIRRFEHQGTRPIQTIESVTEAIKLNHQIGLLNKAKRLKYLQESWTKPFRDSKKIQINIPEYPDGSAAIANVSVQGKSPGELAQWLWDKHQIFTVAIDHPVIKGVRITPHLSNSITDIQKLIAALRELE
ncbi:MAG: aminotransferase class V-fold PLP-dependent enzyme [Bacteroidota bacterium]|nr:aminotransferase class V-fold PLP-dependent enzyme [Bacteroidota bacterium]MDX5431299.1 aminotransferase class V-fold PLP-dependent enzyme [Bacteroidota bacterium]MDX5470037.1 aminotransferase class V-fold PLP-dependent enzyme [Bacteroidota bacterium]